MKRKLDIIIVLLLSTTTIMAQVAINTDSTVADPGEVTASFDIAIHAGDYIVTITNGVDGNCSYSDTVTVVEATGTPSIPETISGLNDACTNTISVAYSMDAMPGALSNNW